MVFGKIFFQIQFILTFFVGIIFSAIFYRDKILQLKSFFNVCPEIGEYIFNHKSFFFTAARQPGLIKHYLQCTLARTPLRGPIGQGSYWTLFKLIRAITEIKHYMTVWWGGQGSHKIRHQTYLHNKMGISRAK